MKDMDILFVTIAVIIYWKYYQWIHAAVDSPLSIALFVLFGVVCLIGYFYAGHYIEKVINEVRKFRNGTKFINDSPRIKFPFKDYELDGELKGFVENPDNAEETFLGLDAERSNHTIVKLADEERCKGLHVLGISGSGKSTFFESLIIQDALKNRPIIIIDAKGEVSFIDRLNALLTSVGRGKDFHIFSLSHQNVSGSYNPLFAGDSDPQIIIDSFFDIYEDNNAFFRETAKSIFTNVYYILHSISKYFTPLDIYTYITNDDCRVFINKMIKKDNEQGTIHLHLLNQIIRDLTDQYRGWKHVVTGFNNYILDFSSPLLNEADSDIILEDCVRERKIVYFQLPTNAYPDKAKNIARLVQSNMRYISSLIQLGKIPKDTLISFNVDEFSLLADERYKYLLSMGRSSLIMTTIAHQSLSDLENISETFKKGIDHNTHNKIYLKQKDAELCDAIAKDIGTYMTQKPTYRVAAGKFGVSRSIGDVSYRPVNEFHFPPDRIRKLHPFGQGYYINNGSDTYTCINMGRFKEMEGLAYTKKVKKQKHEGLNLFEKFYACVFKDDEKKARKSKPKNNTAVEFDD